MQTIKQIQQILGSENLHPQKSLGQCFLIDGNLMDKLLDLAKVLPDRNILEVGPGTGSLTEMLITTAHKVVAVELDRKLAKILTKRLANIDNFTLVTGDILKNKHTLSPEVLCLLTPEADMVANLPYSIATSIVANCLVSSWRAFNDTNKQISASRALNDVNKRDSAQLALNNTNKHVSFGSLTFMVQSEVADRLAAGSGDKNFGAVSVLVSLLGKVTMGTTVPASAFWPSPKVQSRIMRIDFIPAQASKVKCIDSLQAVLRLIFGQRRKQVGKLLRKSGNNPQLLLESLTSTGANTTLRAQALQAETFLALANTWAANNTLCEQ